MAKRRIKARELVADIRTGLCLPDLSNKYDLSEKTLKRLLEQCVDASVLDQSELDRLVQPQEAITISWKCPGCGMPYSREFDECPSCGIIVSKYLKVQQQRKQYPKCGQSHATSSCL